jgi:hypothetical protein
MPKPISNYGHGEKNSWKILNPVFSYSSKSHIPKGVWSRKAHAGTGLCVCKSPLPAITIKLKSMNEDHDKFVIKYKDLTTGGKQAIWFVGIVIVIVVVLSFIFKLP